MCVRVCVYSHPLQYWEMDALVWDVRGIKSATLRLKLQLKIDFYTPKTQIQLNNDQIPDFICGYLNYDQNVLTPPSRSSNKMLPLLIHVYVGPWLCSADHFHVCVCVKPT